MHIDMHLSWSLIALAAHLASLMRVLIFRHHGSHSRNESYFVFLFVALLGGAVIDLALHIERVGFYQAAIACVLTVFVYRSRGNVARLVWKKEQLG